MTDAPQSSSAEPRWQALSSAERRVLGVLVEKAKTTPDAYPLSLNGIVVGANQKNNRYPLMNLDTESVEAALERLRSLGAVAEVQGSGRVAKYRHYFYEWLGVDKPESAVMTELLLRGAQTEGELRGRVSRMEPIADLPALRAILDALEMKRLVISLTPDGRGHMLTHNLYEPRELEKLRAEFAASGASRFAADDEAGDSAGLSPQRATASGGDLRGELQTLRGEVAELRQQLQEALDQLEQLRVSLGV